MRNRQLPSDISNSLPVSEFFSYAESWLLDCEMRQLSPRVLDLRRLILDKFQWFLRQREMATVNKLSIRAFLHYVSTGHQDAGGRWGNARNAKAVLPATVQMYHRHLRACCNWIVSDESLDESPMASVAAPINRPDQVAPFTVEQVDRLLEAARKTKSSKRDLAILHLLLDTGMRVSELCALKMRDVDLISYQVRVQGKGDKERSVAFGRYTRKALWDYLRDADREPHDPFFVAEGGQQTGEALTRNGVYLMFRRLGKTANIDSTRCSPHTARHTFAIQFLRNGGNQFTLMVMLGHTDVKQTNIYVQIAQADVTAQHRLYSPMDRHRRKKSV